MKRIIFFTIICALLSFSFAEHKKDYWRIIESLRFSNTVNAETNEINTSYIFSKKAEALEGKTITLKGYLAPEVYLRNLVLLTNHKGSWGCAYGMPNASQVVHLDLNKSVKTALYAQGDLIIKGKLVLNKESPTEGFAYLLREVECLNCETSIEGK